MSRVAAQSDSPAADEQASAAATAPVEEITVLGHRLLRDLRLEVQVARESVYDLFNSLNDNDEFDIHCRTGTRTGTKIARRICIPQFVDSATDRATKWYIASLKAPGWINGIAAAQAEMGFVPLKERLLAAKVQRLARENRQFQQAIADYQAIEARYQGALRGAEIQTLATVVDTAGATLSGGFARRGGTVAPRPVDLALPEVRPTREGWIKLRYSVRADGSTTAVRAVDAMPPELDTSGAVKAAAAWIFRPAAESGVPIDWHNNLAVVVFSRGDMYDGSIEFAGAYGETAELIAQRRLEDARVRNERMQRQHAATLEEFALAQMQLAATEHALERPQRALAAIQRATEPTIPGLLDEELKLALEHRFALEIELGHSADALRTYERRVELERLQASESLARQGTALRQALAAPDAVQAVQGHLGTSGLWEHALSWRTFEVGAVQGGIENLGLECHRRRTEFPFQPNVQMTIPVSWGDCAVTLRGRPETTFTVYEFAEAATAQ